MMNEMDKLISICEAFKRGEFGVRGFQEYIETVYLPNDCKHTLERFQHNAHNQLEKIIYFYGEDDLERANNVADQLIRATKVEQERLGMAIPYAV
ncbi:MAG: hypothetical protein LBE35_11650 [Clostridiales bacterium]|jgi:hypothetical protein|nr:hypothetical protein [Clostridiales bacterium]